MMLSVVIQALSREKEYEADRLTAETSQHRQDLADALRKLAEPNQDLPWWVNAKLFLKPL